MDVILFTLLLQRVNYIWPFSNRSGEFQVNKDGWLSACDRNKRARGLACDWGKEVLKQNTQKYSKSKSEVET